jgi:hypothetical protein
LRERVILGQAIWGSAVEICALPADIALIEGTVRRLLTGHETDRTLSATKLAQALSPDDYDLSPSVRKAAVKLALPGEGRSTPQLSGAFSGV